MIKYFFDTITNFYAYFLKKYEMTPTQVEALKKRGGEKC